MSVRQPRRQKQRLLLLPFQDDSPDMMPLTTSNGSAYRCQLIEIDAPDIDDYYLDLPGLEETNMASMAPSKSSASENILCKLCSVFARDIQLSNFGDSEADTLTHWAPLEDREQARIWDPRGSTESKSSRPHMSVAFQHHPTFGGLASSTDEGCMLCSMIKGVLEAYDSIEHDLLRVPLKLQLLPSAAMSSNSAMRDIRNLLLRVQTLEDNMIGWKHICNVLELSKVQDVLEIGRMKSDDNKSLGVEEFLNSIQNAEATDEGPRARLQFDHDMHRDVPQDPRGEDAIILPRLWLDTCVSGHSRCGLPDSALPTRVINVSFTKTTRQPFLFVSNGTKARYVALSYCWGDTMPAKLTTETLNGFQTSIDLATLPKTFQDAVYLTRSLKIPYLWIDALCILQDSQEDWRQEAPKMKQVYQGSTLTISVLRANDVQSGFLANRGGFKVLLPASRSDGKRYVIRQPCRDLRAGLRQSKLVTRGWCFQERMMSPRILHIGQEQNYWECRSVICQEDGVVEGSDAGFAQSKPEFSEHRLIREWIFQQGLPKFDTQYTLWQRAVEIYSQMSLTFDSDRLTAIAGLAQKFQENGAGPYVWGLWKKDILAGLHWVPYNERGFAHNTRAYEYENSDCCANLTRTASCQAPSWSWVSVTGRLRFLLDHRLDEHILGYSVPVPPKGELFSCEVLGIDQEKEDTVDVTACKATLRLGAFYKEVLYLPPDDGRCCGELVLTGKDDSDPSMSIRGCIMDADRHTKRICTCVLLYAKEQAGTERPSVLATFLILDVLDHRPDSFYRVGFCYTLLNPDIFSIELFSIREIKIE